MDYTVSGVLELHTLKLSSSTVLFRVSDLRVGERHLAMPLHVYKQPLCDRIMHLRATAYLHCHHIDKGPAAKHRMAINNVVEVGVM